MTTTTGTTARRGSALALGGLVAALALTACGTEVAGGSGGGLAPLRIGTGAGGGLPAADSGGGKVAASGWTLSGSLPAGPGTGPVLRFTGAPGEDDVRALAAALGLSASPDTRAHGWIVDGPGGELRVRNDASGQWSFSRGTDCPSYYVDVDNDGPDSVVSCAVAEGPGDGTATDLPLVTDDAALAAAAPVLSAAGVDAAPRVLDGARGPAGTTTTVGADPTVADLPTYGLQTLVDVDADGVSGAMGWLGDLEPSGDYPVISAQDAFDRLAAMPRPLAEMACPSIAPGPMETPGEVPGDDPLPGCGGFEPPVITGAVFGLTVSWEDGTAILVPAWLFTVQGWDDPLAQVAVADQYLADPTPAPEPTTGTGGGSAVPPDPGQTDTPVEPPSVEPGDPGTSGGGSDGSGGEPVAPGSPAVEKAYVDSDGRTLALTGWGGVCSEFTAIADESATTVKVQVVERSTLGPDGACVDMAQEWKAVVELDAPLGDREIVDATTGLPVPVTRT
ncbi:MAG: hypothetical protein AB7O74_08595 [Candidatus Nanopelagicales bacterium]